MGDKVTINMDAAFVEWWSTLPNTAYRSDQSVMVIAWWSWEKCKEVMKNETSDSTGGE